MAAALAYGINGGTDGDTVLVVDVGGGTFDVRWVQQPACYQPGGSAAAAGR